MLLAVVHQFVVAVLICMGVPNVLPPIQRLRPEGIHQRVCCAPPTYPTAYVDGAEWIGDNCCLLPLVVDNIHRPAGFTNRSRLLRPCEVEVGFDVRAMTGYLLLFGLALPFDFLSSAKNPALDEGLFLAG